ncbi:MAG: hypothetical protein J5792_05095 [Bacteroidales bacterium]|nr:hypothetical protein [Bacteroidales bacterium]
MITAENFNAQLKQFFTRTSEPVQGLEELIRTYPYFQLARVMQAKKSEDKAERGYLAMVYEDRAFLYKLIRAESMRDFLPKEEAPAAGDEEGEMSLDELVRKFTENPPKISKFMEDFSEEVQYADLGKSSSIERMNIVSETLAEIYLSQKEYDRAIKIYKVLMEKHPEKSATFAAAIEAVKLKKNTASNDR